MELEFGGHTEEEGGGPVTCQLHWNQEGLQVDEAE